MPIATLMFHYVRDNEKHRYNTHCRRINEFIAQMEMLINTKNGIVDVNDIDQVTYYLKHETELAFLMTFDDGYKDQLECAKILNREGKNGIFFIATKTLDNKFLDTNLIHMLLGTEDVNSKIAISWLFNYFKKEKVGRIRGRLVSIGEYIRTYTESIDNSDSNEDRIVKRLLQRDLCTIESRESVLLKMLKELSQIDLVMSLKELYLSKKDLLLMKTMGMEIGSHTKSHVWLSHQTKTEQKKEIIESIKAIKELMPKEAKTISYFCYPFGDYNLDTVNLVEECRIDFAFTTKVGLSKLKEENSKYRYELARFDTNDFWDDEYRRPMINRMVN